MGTIGQGLPGHNSIGKYPAQGGASLQPALVSRKAPSTQKTEENIPTQAHDMTDQETSSREPKHISRRKQLLEKILKCPVSEHADLANKICEENEIPESFHSGLSAIEKLEIARKTLIELSKKEGYDLGPVEMAENLLEGGKEVIDILKSNNEAIRQQTADGPESTPPSAGNPNLKNLFSPNSIPSRPQNHILPPNSPRGMQTNGAMQMYPNSFTPYPTSEGIDLAGETEFEKARLNANKAYGLNQEFNDTDAYLHGAQQPYPLPDDMQPSAPPMPLEMYASPGDTQPSAPPMSPETYADYGYPPPPDDYQQF